GQGEGAWEPRFMARVDRLFRVEGRRPDPELSDRFSALFQWREPRAPDRLRRLFGAWHAHFARIFESCGVPQSGGRALEESYIENRQFLRSLGFSESIWLRVLR